MSKGETKFQKDKKNKNRLLAKERGMYSSIQRNYAKKKEEVINENQLKLI